MLFARNVLDALLMATASKLCVEELVKALAAGFFGDEATREYDDIGVVVLAYEMGYFGLPYKACTDLLVLVEGHGDAFARAAHGYAWIDLAVFDAFGEGMAVGGVVAGVFGVCAVIFIGNAFLF